MVNYSNLYFPNGCNICGGEVKYHKDIFIYKCNNCEAWADSHRKGTIKNNAFEPTESLANQTTHEIRSKLRHIFGKLYIDKIQRIVKKEIIYTTIINIIYPENIISYNDGRGNSYAKTIYSKEDIIQIEFISNGLTQYVKTADINKVSNRSKALLWLSLQLNISVDRCKIGFLNINELNKAIEICYNAYIEGAKLSLI